MIILPGAGLNDAHTKKAVVDHAMAVLKLKENHRALKNMVIYGYIPDFSIIFVRIRTIILT